MEETVESDGAERQRQEERDTVRGCLNTEGVQSGVFAAPREWVSERASDWADQRINVGGLGVADSELIWLSASAIVPETGLLYASVTVLWLLAHRYRLRVPASAFLYMTLSPCSRRRAPPFLRNKRAAKSHDARDRSLSVSLFLSLFLPSPASPGTIIVNYCERKKKIARLLKFLRAFSDEPLIRLVASWNFLYCVK